MTQQVATNVHWHHGEITRADRNRLLNQKAATLWFTGLSGSGKSTIAVALEGALHEMGKISYRLDGDNIRLGINKNLGFSAEDRHENIRRIGEIAKLFVDTGVIALSSFISPYRTDRDNVRQLHEEAGIPSRKRRSATPRACTRKPAPARSRISPASTTPTIRRPIPKFTSKPPT